MVRILNCSTCFSSYFDKQNAISSMLNIEIKEISLQSSRIPTGLRGHLCSVRTGDTAQIRPRRGGSSSLAALQGSPERRKEMFYLTTHSTHFIYGYMASVIW